MITEEVEEKPYRTMKSALTEEEVVMLIEEKHITIQTPENKNNICQQGSIEGKHRRQLTEENVNVELSDISDNSEKFPQHAGGMQLTNSATGTSRQTEREFAI